MSANKKKRLDYLVAQYAGRCIQPGELAELKSLVNISNDEELSEPLRSIWMDDEYPLYMPNKNQKIRMTKYIEQSVQKERQARILPLHKRFIRTFSRIAAVLIIGLFTGICIYLYRSNQHWSIYKNNEITLNVGNGQEAEFILPDGTSVRLNSGSTLRYASHFGMDNRLVHFAGEAFFDVKQDKNRPFIVHTDYMDIEVLGTTFNVDAYEDNDVVEMTLLTGKVKATPVKGPGSAVFVKPNEKVICDIATGQLTVQKTDVKYETAWLNGEIIFKSEPLQSVLVKLERQYNIHIHYEGNPDLLNDRFSGRIRKYSPVYDIMDMMAEHYSLKYEQKNDLFILSDRKTTTK